MVVSRARSRDKLARHRRPRRVHGNGGVLPRRYTCSAPAAGTSPEGLAAAGGSWWESETPGAVCGPGPRAASAAAAGGSPGFRAGSRRPDAGTGCGGARRRGRGVTDRVLRGCVPAAGAACPGRVAHRRVPRLQGARGELGWVPQVPSAAAFSKKDTDFTW
jgi:hypothetical protein